MNIYINGRFLTQRLTGINRFAYEITRHLAKLIKVFVIVPKGKIDASYDIKDLNIIEFGLLSSHLWEQICLPLFFLNKKNYVLVNLSGLGSIIIKQKIVTIHDVSFLFHPKWFSKLYYYTYKLLTPLIIKTSQKILTVSEFSKSEIIRYYHIYSDNIDVIYNAVTGFKKRNGSKSTKKFILTVGSIDPRKNFRILLDVFNDSRLKDVDLHIVGDVNKIFNETIESKEIKDNIKFLGRISDKELIEQYSNASLFILPSLYEGFGIPPLEALMCECPIAVSDIPVFHEILGNSALYFNPNDKEEIIKLILDSSNNPYYDQETVQKILAKYSWEKSAKNVLNTIKKL